LHFDVFISDGLDEGEACAGDSVEHVHCPKDAAVFFLFDGGELVAWFGEETACFGEADCDPETYKGAVGTALVDVDKDAEDDGLEEGESDDTFSNQRGDYLVCCREVLFYELCLAIGKVGVFRESGNKAINCYSWKAGVKRTYLTAMPRTQYWTCGSMSPAASFILKLPSWKTEYG
jgi:hypothetical protein